MQSNVWRSPPSSQPESFGASGAVPSWMAPVRPWNPLHDHAQASGLSNYFGIEDGALVRGLGGDRAQAGDDEAVRRAHDGVIARILAPGFPCVAARSAINRERYRFGLYPALGSPQAGLALCHDLYEFSHEFRPSAPGQPPQHQFATFIAAFQAPSGLDEVEFERLLWRQLQQMHAIDAGYFEWDGSVAKDPQDPSFSFSVGGRAFFVVGMNPAASRKARVVEQPVLVFNPHDQFEALREAGKFEQLQGAIRQRDVALQGSINPVLSAFGQQAESRQYSGRAVPANWQCPFKAMS